MYKLLKENTDHYEMQHPSGDKFVIAKKGLNSKVVQHIQKLSDGGEVEDIPLNTSPAIPEQFSNPNPGQESVSQGIQNTPVVPETPYMSESDQATLAQAPQQAQPVQEAPQAQEVTPSTPVKPAPQSPTVMGAYQLGVEGAKGAAQAQEVQGTENAKTLGDLQSKIIETDKIHQASQAAQLKSLEDLQNKASTDINPNRYFGNMNTGNKISAAIGLIFGGLGAGLTHGDNQALKVIQNAIDHDVESQKNDQSKNMNLYRTNLEKYKDAETAHNQTKLQLMSLADLKMKQAEQTAKSAEAKAAFSSARSGLQLQAIPLLQKEAVDNTKRALMQKAQMGEDVDPATLVQYMVPEPHQKMAFEEISRAQDTRHMASDIVNSFDNAVKENTVLKTGAGMLRTPGSVLALHQAMQPTFKDLEGTVRQAAMDNTFKNITPAPGDSQYTIDTKRQALLGYLESKKSAPTAKGFGIDLDKFQSTRTIRDQAQQTQYKTVNGVKYMRGKNGEAVRVN